MNFSPQRERAAECAAMNETDSQESVVDYDDFYGVLYNNSMDDSNEPRYAKNVGNVLPAVLKSTGRKRITKKTKEFATPPRKMSRMRVQEDDEVSVAPTMAYSEVSVAPTMAYDKDGFPVIQNADSDDEDFEEEHGIENVESGRNKEKKEDEIMKKLLSRLKNGEPGKKNVESEANSNVECEECDEQGEEEEKVIDEPIDEVNSSLDPNPRRRKLMVLAKRKTQPKKPKQQVKKPKKQQKKKTSAESTPKKKKINSPESTKKKKKTESNPLNILELFNPTHSGPTAEKDPRIELMAKVKVDGELKKIHIFTLSYKQNEDFHRIAHTVKHAMLARAMTKNDAIEYRNKLIADTRVTCLHPPRPEA